MANRLRVMLDCLIYESQKLDSMLIANEWLNSRLKCHTPGFVSWTLKKPMIMWIGMPYSICWAGWVLGWDRGGVSRLLSLLFVSLFLWMDPLKFFWKLSWVETKWSIIPSSFPFDYVSIKSIILKNWGEWSYLWFSCGTS